MTADRILRWLLAALVDIAVSLFAALGAEAVSGADVRQLIVEDECDIVIINHFADEQCRPVFDQQIWLEWNGRDSVYDVIDWRLLKTQSQIPTPCPNGQWESLWHDGDQLRRVRADQFIENFTQYDPEFVARDRLPIALRRKLFEVRKLIGPVEVSP